MSEATPRQKSILRYKLEVEPLIQHIMGVVVRDAGEFGITEDEVVHGVWEWVNTALLDKEHLPDWLMEYYAKERLALEGE